MFASTLLGIQAVPVRSFLLSTYGGQNFSMECDSLMMSSLLGEMSIPRDLTFLMSYNTSAFHPNRNNPGVLRCLLNRPENFYKPELFSSTSVSLKSFRSKLMHHYSSMDRTQPAFIFISGHGNAKMVFFNNGNVIFSDELETLLDIIAVGFRTVFVVLDSCKSGSLFEGIKLPANVIALTSSNSTARSYSCSLTWHPKVGDYLAGSSEFTSSFFKGMKFLNTKDTTAQALFNYLDNTMLLSGPQIFGTEEMRNKKIEELFGTSVVLGDGVGSPPKSECHLDGFKRSRGGSNLLSPEIKFITEILMKNVSYQYRLAKELKLSEKLSFPLTVCYKQSIRHFIDKCLDNTVHSTISLEFFENLCSIFDKDDLLKAIHSTCD